MRYLLDSGILGDLSASRHGIPERIQAEKAAGHIIGTCVPVLAEQFYGVEKSQSRERNMRNLLQALERIKLWPFDRVAAEAYGRLAALLDQLGRQMQQVDMMVAAVAFAFGNCTVVTKDTDLSAVPGLSVENWAV